ncbi:hypothetical protein [Sphingomonas sp.]|uniref:hypothetical protein n=1 Tax=Sphingomonas sp. TaxID=28214 RepID=UPI003AFFA6DD
MPFVLALAALLAGPIAMTPPRALRHDIAAYPRIARPATAAARRINAAVARLDAAVLREAAQCRRDAGPGRGSWERAVTATMRGPAFVSYRATDDVDCGGAHPNDSHAAIVYDLATGAPVDWTALLGRRLAGTLTPETVADGVKMVTLASPRLFALYAAGYDASLRAEGAPAECLGLVDTEGFGEQPLQAWLDGPRGALVLQFDLNHAMQACSTPVALSADVLRREGASRRLVAALLAARRAGRPR